MGKKQLPASIKNAQEALKRLKESVSAEQFLQLKKQLPAYAKQQEEAGHLLTASALQKAAENGLLSKGKAQQDKPTYHSILQAKKQSAHKPIAAISVQDGAIYHFPKDADPALLQKVKKDHKDIAIITSPYDASFVPRMSLAYISKHQDFKLYDFLYATFSSEQRLFEKKAISYAVEQDDAVFLKHLEKVSSSEKGLSSFHAQVAIHAAIFGKVELCLESAEKALKEDKNNIILNNIHLEAAKYKQEDVLIALSKQNKAENNMNISHSVLLDSCLTSACKSGMAQYFSMHMPSSTTDLEEYCDEALKERQYEIVDLILQQNSNLADQYARRTVPRYNLSQPPSAAETYVIAKNAPHFHSIVSQFYGSDRGSKNARDALTKNLERASLWDKKTSSLPPRGCTGYSPAIFKKKTYQDCVEMLKDENLQADTSEFYAFQISTLMRTTDRVLQFLDKWGDANSTQPLHDLIYDLELPKTGRYDLKSWGDAVLQHGPKMARLVAFADHLPEPMKSSNGKTYSYHNTLAEAAKREYAQSEQYPEISQYAFSAQYTEGDFECAIDLHNEFNALVKKGTTIGKNIPDIRIEGDIFDKPGYHFRKLEPGDIRGMFLGSITDCCQHIGGAGSECAEHGYTSEDGGFYVIAHNDTDKIIGQAWAWRGAEDELVLDSLEAKAGMVSKDEWQKILSYMVDHIQNDPGHRLNITALHVGDGGRTPVDLSNDKEGRAHPADYNGYRDSHSQYRIWKR